MNMVKPEGIKKKKKRWFSKGIYLKNAAIGIEKKLERGFDRWTLCHISRDEDEWLSSVTMTSDFLDKTRKYCDALRSALLKSTEILVGAFKAWTVKLLKNQSIYCSFWFKKKTKKKPYHQFASSTINVHAFCRVNFDSKEQAKLRKHNRPVWANNNFC